MRCRILLLAPAAMLAAACSAASWPEPPAVDEARYQAEYQEWLAGQQATLDYALPMVGIWPLPEGEVAFGGQPTLPIALPGGDLPPRLGVFRRAGDRVTVIPDTGVVLTRDDGTRVTGPSEMDEAIKAGSLRLGVASLGDDRRWIDAWDDAHPSRKNPPKVSVYPVDRKWRVAARFDAYPTPKPIRIGDVRGGTIAMIVPGELVFRLAGREHRLLALAAADAPSDLFVPFKDVTNGKTTFHGYRILSPTAVAPGDFTVLDFNHASNPPCAYSAFTTCPLPPRENALDVAVEAGTKRLAAQGS